ncbi:mavicyanin-like [Curcuma longa]|uniref:mavicyanin-like n=1 Tax=Curcuma longa TaxID=136217 RepID=UPI003D9EC335
MGKVGFLMAVFVCILCVSEAAVYQVGDEQGWKGYYVNYTEWTASKTFYVGDTIGFEYDKERGENVMMVSLDDFRSCSSNRPIRFYQTGLDKFILVKRAHIYFICGFPDHCLRGQKVDVRVLDRPALPPQTTTRPSRGIQPLSSNSSSPPPQPGPSEQGPSPFPLLGPAPAPARGAGTSVVPQGWAQTLGVVAFVVALA